MYLIIMQVKNKIKGVQAKLHIKERDLGGRKRTQSTRIRGCGREKQESGAGVRENGGGGSPLPVHPSCYIVLE